MDLSEFTTQLASFFRSAIEREGLQFVISCRPLAEPVYVDRGMWEKICFNLISNAFKFTFEGEIDVSLRQAGETVELAVRDTGTGIAAEELPRVFERFHRVQGTRGRTYEGSGIGLALVQELVTLHGGSVRVESVVNRGPLAARPYWRSACGSFNRAASRGLCGRGGPMGLPRSSGDRGGSPSTSRSCSDSPPPNCACR
jgi:signal transduction histidine kinase